MSLLFQNPVQSTVGQLTELVELTVLGTALAKTHLLDIGSEYLYLVISGLCNLPQQLLCLIVFHPNDMDKGQVVKCLGRARMVTAGEVQGLICVIAGTVYIAVMIGIGKIIQPVHGLPIRA